MTAPCGGGQDRSKLTKILKKFKKTTSNAHLLIKKHGLSNIDEIKKRLIYVFYSWQ